MMKEANNRLHDIRAPLEIMRRGVRRTKMKILRTGLIVALIVEVATFVVGFACLFGGIKTLGQSDYLLFPGGILGWLMIWGDNFSNSSGERLGMIAISMATNAIVGFIVGICVATIWKMGKKLWTSNQKIQRTA